MKKITTSGEFEELAIKLHALLLMSEYMFTNGVEGAKPAFRIQFESFLTDARLELTRLKASAGKND